MPGTGNQNGYTLVEVIIVIVIIGILAAVAFKSMSGTIDVARNEETKKEMEQLAYAIAGNPNLISGGNRTDFGYVGDVGALPPDWDALVVNPGGYATWDGPYIQDEFTDGGGDYRFKLDAWEQPYSLPAGNAFSSTGGPETITREFANSLSDLLDNEVILAVTDLDGSPPGPIYRDSVRLILSYPDGAGGMATISAYPDAGGLIRFSHVPMGIHTLRLIYIPNNDTLTRRVAVHPGQDYYADLRHYGDVW